MNVKIITFVGPISDHGCHALLLLPTFENSRGAFWFTISILFVLSQSVWYSSYGLD
eukprot:c22551_g2_i1 orf=64-231(+)